MWEDDDVPLFTQESFDRYHARIAASVAALEDPDDDVPLFTQERFAAARAAAAAAATAAIARKTAMEDPDDNVPSVPAIQNLCAQLRHLCSCVGVCKPINGVQHSKC